MNVLILSPLKYDLVSKTCINWSRELENYALSLGHSVTSMVGIYLDRDTVESHIQSFCPCFIIFIGHGTSYGLLGSENNLCAICVQSIPFLQNSVINAVSCLSAQVLGIEAVQGGAIGYLGYDDELLITYCFSTPLKGFKECELLSAKVILNGGTLAQAYEATISEYGRWIDCYRYEDLIVAAFLQLNHDAFVLYGNPDYKPLDGECIAPELGTIDCSYPAACSIQTSRLTIIGGAIILLSLVSMFKKG